MRFVDEITFAVASGHGGSGHVSFLRERYVARGGPDGGNGGRGGALIFEATKSRNTLVDYRFNKVYRAEDGHSGGRRDMTGRSGKDLVLLVPVGTVIHDAETGEVLADLGAAGDVHRFAGGIGGKGNSHFATSRNRTPRFGQDGQPGIELRVRLELRLLADVGLLGLPNAGKSTLISRISAARPKVAEYPFTTLVPNLGVVRRGLGDSFVVADVPGLIEGASEGAGLGHQFLRHLTRCRVLVHLIAVDADGDLPTLVQALRGELEAYDPTLADRETLVVLSKVDLLDEQGLSAHLAALAEAGIAAHPISAVSGVGLPELVHMLADQVQSSFVDGLEASSHER